MTPIAADTYPAYLVVSAGAMIVGVVGIGAYRYWPRRKKVAAAPLPEATVIVEPEAERHVRTPSDVLHLIVGVLLVLIGLAVAAGASNTLVGFERDTISAFDFLPEAVARALYYLFQGLASLIPAAVGLFVLWKRRFRLFGMLILAALIAQSIASFLNGLIVDKFGKPELLAAVVRPAWLREVASIGVIDSTFIAGMVSTVVLGSPWIGRPWRRLGWAIVVLAVLFRAAAAQDGPLDVVLAVGAGIVGGSVVLLIFGAPNRRPRGPAVAAAMLRAGIPLARLERAGVDARSSTPYFGARGGRLVAVPQGAGPRRAQRRPDVPPLPLPAAEGRRRPRAVHVAAEDGGARGARRAVRERLGRAHTAARRHHQRRRRRLPAGLRAHAPATRWTAWRTSP